MQASLAAVLSCTCLWNLVVGVNAAACAPILATSPSSKRSPGRRMDLPRTHCSGLKPERLAKLFLALLTCATACRTSDFPATCWLQTSFRQMVFHVPPCRSTAAMCQGDAFAAKETSHPCSSRFLANSFMKYRAWSSTTPLSGKPAQVDQPWVKASAISADVGLSTAWSKRTMTW